jgi:hypothetical protein
MVNATDTPIFDIDVDIDIERAARSIDRCRDATFMPLRYVCRRRPRPRSSCFHAHTPPDYAITLLRDIYDVEQRPPPVTLRHAAMLFRFSLSHA